MVSACSTTLPQDASNSSVKKTTMSKATCDAWNKKVEAARQQIGKCTQDSDCTTDFQSGSCDNDSEYYNRSANYSGFIAYRDNYYSTCSVSMTQTCGNGPSSITCRQGQCAPIY